MGYSCHQFFKYLSFSIFTLKMLILALILAIILYFEIQPNMNATELAIILLSSLSILLIPILGCCCSISNSRAVHCMVSLLLLLLIFLQAIIGTFVWIGHIDLPKFVEQTAYRVVTEKYDGQQPELPIVKLWDNLQQGLSCCGSTGYEDWTDSRFISATEVLEIGIQVRSRKMSQNLNNLPLSCCRMRDPSSTLQTCNHSSQSLFLEGCGTKITEMLSYNTPLIISVMSGFLLLEIILALSFWFLVCCKKEIKTTSI